jgi:hypothetical protein
VRNVKSLDNVGQANDSDPWIADLSGHRESVA